MKIVYKIANRSALNSFLDYISHYLSVGYKERFELNAGLLRNRGVMVCVQNSAITWSGYDVQQSAVKVSLDDGNLLFDGDVHDPYQDKLEAIR